jgi:AraC family transcriptional regulator of adaptative response/methylated-DNA-[protein]-cysteine methyltransferase
MNRQYDIIATALDWLVRNQHSQPGLAELSASVGLSEAHLQRTFQAFTGVSPKQFLKHLTREEALRRLRDGETVLDAALGSGLSGPGRLHDLLVTTEAITPGEARRQGGGVRLRYGKGQTPFGPAFIAWNERGITFLGFCTHRSAEEALEELRAQWPDAVLEPAPAQQLLNRVFGNTSDRPLEVWLRGSPFQLKVWEALLRIPEGLQCSYGSLAVFLGRPSASRAVGTAVGRNPVSWLIPCHRVITSLGGPGGYRWGIETKLAMVGTEATWREGRMAA